MIGVAGEKISLDSFEDEIEAAKAYDKAVKILRQIRDVEFPGLITKSAKNHIQ